MSNTIEEYARRQIRFLSRTIVPVTLCSSDESAKAAIIRIAGELRTASESGNALLIEEPTTSMLNMADDGLTRFSEAAYRLGIKWWEH